MFAPQAQSGPHDKLVDLNNRQHSQEIVSKKAASETLCSPYAMAAITPSIAKPDLPSTSVSPASPNNDPISNKDQLMTLLKTVNNEAYDGIGLPMVKIWGGELENEWLIEAVEVHGRSNEYCSNDGELVP
ncbi:hypothetical protein AX14_004929 [Amanita brunnescens Koide BX004]|nr:hypothetical protein AX14_004929 [Amanita brunnescens Koide BX004]